MSRFVVSSRPRRSLITNGVMRRMKDEGCDAVVLGCTEIPLIMNDSNSPLPTLDSTRLLARERGLKLLRLVDVGLGLGRSSRGSMD
jgi:aspartate/glutamate racemase